MSNYQMLQAVALHVNEGSNRWTQPNDSVFWDHLVDFLESKYDARPEDLERARSRLLPACLCPTEGHLVTSATHSRALFGDYWACSMVSMEYFWLALWQVGNRGRVVMEFQQEGTFGEDNCFSLPGDGGGFYAVMVEMADEGVSRTTYYDDRDFYDKVKTAREAALQVALSAAGVTTEEALEEGYFYWSARESIDDLNMYQRMTLIDAPDLGLDVVEHGFLKGE